MTHPPESRRGLIHGATAYALWGLLPLYFHLVDRVDAGEIVAQRVLWSVVLLVPIVLLLGRRGKLWAALRTPKVLAMLAASAALIAANWLMYVWAVLHHQVLAASMAYFLNPLLNIAMGVALLNERLTRAQAVAVLLAGAGVAVLAFGADGGLWISLTIALSFAFYGLIRKLAPVEAFEGLTIETLLLAPVALGYVAWLSGHGGLSFGREAGLTALLVLAGAVTTVPLLLFAAAARELRMATLGLLQFVAPSLQFLLAITLFGERLDARTLVSFALIWAGLAVYVGGSLAGRRRRVAAEA
ncbi:EamA family transporter RarD [Sphingomonas sp. PL-96]|uniref:EamA family transporter RarD n=1 Tax=Sphingomonas sp. PL-96 TaxID=2887201 RepID=UPI001E30363C|nr:EamA family transporter RarD [Sphingomonas sp. PL-96]MCC2978477.1 EamA family transporter RarD [Sphingomonas sp. PL-96]